MVKNLISEKLENELRCLKDGTITLAQWFNVWISVYKHNAIRESSKAIYTYLFEHYVSPALGDKLLRDISSLDCKMLFNVFDDAGLSFSTRSRLKYVLDNLFELAHADSFMPHNPLKGLHVTKGSVKERRVLTLSEQSEFLKMSKESFYENLFVVALCTGLRIGELGALTQSDLDFERKLIYVTKTIVHRRFSESDSCYTFKIQPPKTRTSKRIVPMTSQCADALRRQIDLRNDVLSCPSAKPVPGFSDLVFVSTKGRPVTASIVYTAIASVVKRINRGRDGVFEFKPFSSHTFRHTFATRCFESGMNAKTVQVLLGHASINMTMDLYTHVTEEKKAADVTLLDRLMMHIEKEK